MLSRGKMGGMPDSSQAIRSKDDHAGCLRHPARKKQVLCCRGKLDNVIVGKKCESVREWESEVMEEKLKTISFSALYKSLAER